MPRPKISVCIPTFNRLGSLRKTIENILSMKSHAFELVISDNGSTDGTAEYLRSIRDRRVRVSRNERNLGQVANFRKCISLARGKYVAIFHDDVIYDKSILSVLAKPLEEDPSVGLSFCAVRREYPREKRTVNIIPRLRPRTGAQDYLRLQLISPNDTVLSGVNMLRRSAAVRAGSYDSSYLVRFDAKLYIGIAELGYAFAFTPRMLATDISLDDNQSFRPKVQAALPFETWRLMSGILSKHPELSGLRPKAVAIAARQATATLVKKLIVGDRKAAERTYALLKKLGSAGVAERFLIEAPAWAARAACELIVRAVLLSKGRSPFSRIST